MKDKYPGLPLIYRRGDIVRVVGTDKYGIVLFPADDQVWKQYLDMRLGQLLINVCEKQISLM